MQVASFLVYSLSCTDRMMTQEEWPRFQECKLHLTISLDGSDVSHACMVTAQKFPMNVRISATVMQWSQQSVRKRTT